MQRNDIKQLLHYLQQSNIHAPNVLTPECLHYIVQYSNVAKSNLINYSIVKPLVCARNTQVYTMQ